MRRRPVAAGIVFLLLLGTAAARTEEIGIETEDGWRLAATYLPAKGKPGGGVVLIHMLSRKRADWLNLMETPPAPAGLATLSYDIRGHGESRKLKGRSPSFKDFNENDWAAAVKDAAAAVRKLGEISGLPRGRIALLGASIGCNIALNYAAGDPEIRALTLLSPGLDYRGLRTLDALKRYGGRPLFLVASSEDKYAYFSSAELEKAARGPKLFRRLSGAGHGTQMLRADPALAGKVAAWLKAGFSGR